tara:strand:+ start:2366 stop:3211 length:846 start_codon:yes stop_codon:yes gene_type:complete
MKYTKIKSYAKINLALNIVGKNSTLHKIESIIAFIDLHDIIMIKSIKSNKHNISFTGKFCKNITKQNTISTLLKVLENKKLLNNQKFKIKIKKQIPNKAGLGGGSMNAASILKYFIKKKIIANNKKKVMEISKLIGSDVILGLKSTNSILTSTNKIKYFKKCEKFYTLIVKPDFGCSTKNIYSKVKKYNKPRFNRPLKKIFSLNYLKKTGNSLEPIVLSKYSQLKKIKLYLENLSKPEFVRMTGSGSAFVAYFLSKERCDIAKKMFTKKYRNYWCIVSKTI